jgi:hypothetical protein
MAGNFGGNSLPSRIRRQFFPEKPDSPRPGKNSTYHYVPNCKTDPTFLTGKELQNNESQLQDVLTALDAYCGGPNFSYNKGNCRPPADQATKTRLADKLKVALDNLNHNIGTARALCEWQPTPFALGRPPHS